MIQRIQTLQLLGATICMIIMLLLPLASFTISADNQVVYLTALGIKGSGEHLVSAIYLSIIAVISTLLPLITIFLFKNRNLQVSLCTMSMVTTIGTIAIAVVYYFRLRGLIAELNTGDIINHISLVNVMPLISLFLIRLAMKNIIKDELLVRSADRLR